MPLTKKQEATLDALRNKTYSDILVRDLTSAINAAFAKNESRELKKELIKGGIEWYINNPKSKVKDPALINKRQHRHSSSKVVVVKVWGQLITELQK